MSETLPEDPPGYRVPSTDDNRWRLVRVFDDADLGTYDTKQEAVDAANADQDA